MTDQTPPIVVWTEIAVRDLARAVEFYNTVFDWNMTIETTGPMPRAVLGSNGATVSGNLYEGAPAQGGTGSRIHILVTDLAAATERAKQAGARIGAGPVEIPRGRYTRIEDPDGNPIGLFERKAA